MAACDCSKLSQVPVHTMSPAAVWARKPAKRPTKVSGSRSFFLPRTTTAMSNGREMRSRTMNWTTKSAVSPEANWMEAWCCS